MKSPVLVIMAAGMGSRYGGLKQIDKMDDVGHIIMDFSIYDAKLSGFEKVIFIIKEELEEEFQKAIGDRIKDHIEIEYVFQNINDIPEGIEIPKDRKKPWGTAHAILSTYEKIDGPFAVINADDFYGRDSFKLIYDFLVNNIDEYKYAMVGFDLKNTITKHGTVSRGVSKVDENHNLIDVVERSDVKEIDGKIYYLEGENWKLLEDDTTVSMNLWGFEKSFLEELKSRFPKFLKAGIKENPTKWEFYPTLVLNELIEEEKATVKVIKTKEKWLGITYKEDKEQVVESIKELKNQGVYPNRLWEEIDGK